MRESSFNVTREDGQPCAVVPDRSSPTDISTGFNSQCQFPETKTLCPLSSFCTTLCVRISAVFDKNLCSQQRCNTWSLCHATIIPRSMESKCVHTPRSAALRLGYTMKKMLTHSREKLSRCSSLWCKFTKHICLCRERSGTTNLIPMSLVPFLFTDSQFPQISKDVPLSFLHETVMHPCSRCILVMCTQIHGERPQPHV